ncbi:hypothetical protein A1D31_39065 [Bradyrhizobium liaoningense]|nr:hypothetical protein A1D31_39065 [Bradyrhizobium liaoningense]
MPDLDLLTFVEQALFNDPADLRPNLGDSVSSHASRQFVSERHCLRLHCQHVREGSLTSGGAAGVSLDCSPLHAATSRAAECRAAIRMEGSVIQGERVSLGS